MLSLRLALPLTLIACATYTLQFESPHSPFSDSQTTALELEPSARPWLGINYSSVALMDCPTREDNVVLIFDAVSSMVKGLGRHAEGRQATVGVDRFFSILQPPISMLEDFATFATMFISLTGDYAFTRVTGLLRSLNDISMSMSEDATAIQGDLLASMDPMLPGMMASNLTRTMKTLVDKSSIMLDVLDQLSLLSNRTIDAQDWVDAVVSTPALDCPKEVIIWEGMDLLLLFETFILYGGATVERLFQELHTALLLLP